MEFKGTKGKWIMPAMVNRNSFGRPQASIKVKILSGNYDMVACVFGKQITDARANATIIAHAPEMLEILIKVVKEIEWSAYHWGDDRGRELEQEINDLITRATTI